MKKKPQKAERRRLYEANERIADWKEWGPYVSERAWGTVREDYSHDGSAWDYFPFEHAHLRAYRWNEDGLAGICDRFQSFCFGLSLWNEKDKILKERLFGLPGPKGNHGEDVKEYYYYLDSTPTHSYMKFLYKYSQSEFPYQKLYEENARRDKSFREFELADTGVFENDRYFDIFVEYAKQQPYEICIKITAVNRSSEASPLHLLPTVWLRNTWSWDESARKGTISVDDHTGGRSIRIECDPERKYRLYFDGEPDLLFCDNETNCRLLFNSENPSRFTKDGINDHVVNGNPDSVNAALKGTKAACRYKFELQPGETREIYLKLIR